MTATGVAVPALARSAAARAVAFVIAWIVLSAGGSVDLLLGIVAASAATVISLGLLPAGKGRLQPIACAEFILWFLAQSVIAGADVARRALDPRLPVNPGLVRYPVSLPQGQARAAFTTLMSLLPGTVPIGPDQTNALIIHCLDVTQPVAAQLAAAEALLVRAMGRVPGNV